MNKYKQHNFCELIKNKLIKQLKRVQQDDGSINMINHIVKNKKNCNTISKKMDYGAVITTVIASIVQTIVLITGVKFDK